MKTFLQLTILLSLGFNGITMAQTTNVIKEVTLLADTAKVEAQTISMLRTDLVSTIKTDQWYYVVITKSSDLVAKLYINGDLKSTGTWLNQTYVYNQLHIGASYYTSFGSFFTGYLDEFRMSNVVRTDNEVADYYASNQEFAVDANTIGLWHFNEESGTSISNAVPSSATGSLFNGVEFVEGKFNNCLYFDGNSQYGNCNLNIPEHNITFEFWFKISDLIPNCAIMSAYGMNNSHVKLKLEETMPDILWSTGDTLASITVNPDTLDYVWATDGNIYDTIFFNTQSATVYDTTTTEVFDTLTIEVFDTTYVTVTDSISVTDTLIIDAVLTGINPPDNINTLKIYPNPAKDHVFINTGDYTKMNGYQLKIVNQTGAVVFETNVEEPLYEVNLSTWSGMGLYFVQVIDSGGSIIDVRKIILE